MLDMIPDEEASVKTIVRFFFPLCLIFKCIFCIRRNWIHLLSVMLNWHTLFYFLIKHSPLLLVCKIASPPLSQCIEIQDELYVLFKNTSKDLSAIPLIFSCYFCVWETVVCMPVEFNCFYSLLGADGCWSRAWTSCAGIITGVIFYLSVRNIWLCYM